MFLIKIWIIIVLINSGKSVKRHFRLDFYNYTCKSFTTRLKLFECNFAKINSTGVERAGEDIYVFNEYIMFDKNLDKNFDVRIRVDAKQKSLPSIRFVDVKLNVCDMLQNSVQNILLKGLLDETRRSSNMPYVCPFKNNTVYKMENFTMTEKFLPTYTPHLNFTFTVEFFDDGVLFGLSKIMGAAAPK